MKRSVTIVGSSPQGAVDVSMGPSTSSRCASRRSSRPREAAARARRPQSPRAQPARRSDFSLLCLRRNGVFADSVFQRCPGPPLQLPQVCVGLAADGGCSLAGGPGSRTSTPTWTLTQTPRPSTAPRPCPQCATWPETRPVPDPHPGPGEPRSKAGPDHHPDPLPPTYVLRPGRSPRSSPHVGHRTQTRNCSLTLNPGLVHPRSTS
nr:forkhead box protein K2-like [Vicugna pacos]